MVYHGSVNTFEIFDKEKASPEGDMGAGFYFTDNEYDADDNYHDGGPDFDNKVARLAEQIQQEKEDNGEDIDYEEAKEIADKQLRGEPHQFAVYLKMNNPCYVGENETILLQDVFDDIDINEEDYEDYDEYEQARNEAEDEALQTISYEIDDKLGDLLQYNDIERAKGILFEYLYDGGVSLQQLKDRLNEEYFDSYETGDIVSNEVARRIVEALGYDGIIDSSVTDKFSNMNMEYGTTHYIAFYPEQIKAIDNRGTFDEGNPNIYYQSAYHGTPHKFDNFSTEHIGSGEGAQAHGWGLYFAANKNVSENYRKNLIDNHSTYDSIKYRGQHIDNETLKVALFRLKRYGIDDALSYLDNKIDYYNKRYNEAKEKYPDAKEYIQGEKSLLDKAIDIKSNLKKIDINDIDIEEGQLFEVDIPENDVLLDEEEPFSTQTENVKNSIKALIKDLLGIKSFANKDLDEEIKKAEKEKEENYNYIVSRKLELLKDLRFDDTVGKDFYNHLAEYLRVSENITNPQHKKEASLLLNQYGIKGITYDGRSDGRCYVVFDDKAVQVLNTFYQSSMLSDVDLNKNVDIVDLTPKFSTDNNLSKSDLANYIKSLIGNRITTADKKAILSFVARSKRVGKDNVRVPEHIAGSSKVENTLKGERTTIVNNIVDLIKNSTMIEISENNNKTLKPYVDNYIRFYVPVQINNDIYTVRIVAENNLNDNLFNIQIANVYDVIIDKKMPTHSTIKDNSPSNLIEPTSTNIINDNTSKNNPHTITIRDMLQGIKDTENKFYAQENIDNPLDSKRGFSTVRQDFDGTIKENLIVLLKIISLGLPIGFYTSQWLANFFLQDFDHFVKEKLKAKCYTRYVDDKQIFGSNKRKLREKLEKIKEFLSKENLSLKPNYQIFRFSYIDKDGRDKGRPLDFLGFKFFKNRTTLRKRILSNILQKACRIFNKTLKGLNISWYEATQMMSYVGYLNITDTHTWYTKYIRPRVNFGGLKRIISHNAKKKGNKNGIC